MSWQKSINNVILFNFFNNMSFERVLWVVYLLNKNISLIEIGIIQSILSVSMFIFEFPTGFIGDRYGRRNSLFIGNFMILIYLIIFLFSNKFYQFSIGAIFYGVGLTFISGSNEALLYDNLKGLNKEDKYSELISKINFISILGLLISIFLGGILERLSLDLLFIVGIIIRIITAFFIIFITEYPYLVEDKKPVLIDTKASIDFLKTNKILSYLVLTSSLFVSFFSVYILFGQEILRNNGESGLYDVSMIYIYMYILGSIISLSYNKLVKLMRENLLILINSLLILIFLSLSLFNKFNYYFIIFIVVGALYEINDITYNIIINNLATSSLRARIFSIYSLVTTIFMSFFSIVITYVLTNKPTNFNEYLFIMSGIILFISLIGIFRVKKGSINYDKN